MKKNFLLLLSLFLATNLQSVNRVDSLWAVIRSDTTTTGVALWTYDALVNHLIQVDIDSSRKVCHEAIALAKKANNFKHESVFTILLGASFYYQGDYKTTTEHWLNALKISENARDTARIDQLYNNLGILYKTMEDFEKSMEYYQKSLELKMIEGDPEKIAITQMNIGTLLHKMYLHDSAFVYLSKSLEVLKSGTNKRALALIYNNLGAVHMAKKEFELAMESFYQAHEIMEYQPVQERARLLMNMGACLMLHLNRPGEGRNYLDQSLELAEAQQNLFVIRNIYETLSQFYLKTGNYEQAFKYLELEIIYNDSIFTLEKDIQIKEMQATFDFERKEQAMNQQMELEKLERIKQEKINQVMAWIIIAGSLIILVISYLFKKVRKAKHKIEATQHALEKTNADLVLAKAEIERVLEFKSQFLANMSHEVRSPLQGIIGFNSKLKLEISNAKHQEHLHAIEVSSYNLLTLINDVLDMSKIDAGRVKVNPVNSNLKSLIHEVWFFFDLRAKEKSIAFGYEYAEDISEFYYLDALLLRQILVNLVGNAVKFTKEGHVKITVRRAPGKLRVYASSMDDLEILVEDTGIGISPEDQEQVFESFVQAKHHDSSVYGGTGLGLAISKNFAKIMNGDISLESKPGVGSTFTVTYRNVSKGYPFKDEIKGMRPVAAEVNFEFTGGVLLVADDEEINRKMVQSFFEDTRVELHIVENGEKLVEKAKELKPTVILSDMKMPVKNGIEAAKLIKADEAIKDIPIIAFTASIDFPKLDIEIRNLFAECINKPVDINELFKRLSAYLPTTKDVEKKQL